MFGEDSVATSTGMPSVAARAAASITSPEVSTPSLSSRMRCMESAGITAMAARSPAARSVAVPSPACEAMSTSPERDGRERISGVFATVTTPTRSAGSGRSFARSASQACACTRCVAGTERLASATTTTLTPSPRRTMDGRANPNASSTITAARTTAAAMARPCPRCAMDRHASHTTGTSASNSASHSGRSNTKRTRHPFPHQRRALHHGVEPPAGFDGSSCFFHCSK